MGHRPLRRDAEPERQIADITTRTEALERRFILPPAVQWHVKISGDQTTDLSLTSGDKKFQHMVPEDQDGYQLVGVEAYVTTVSGVGNIAVQLAKLPTDGTGTPVDMLTTKVTIDSGEFNSRISAAGGAVINPTHDIVQAGDHIRFDVDGAGNSAKGLGVILTWALPET